MITRKDIKVGDYVTIKKRILKEYNSLDALGVLLKVKSIRPGDDNPIHAVGINVIMHRAMDIFSFHEIEAVYTKETNPEYFL